MSSLVPFIFLLCFLRFLSFGLFPASKFPRVVLSLSLDIYQVSYVLVLVGGGCTFTGLSLSRTHTLSLSLSLYLSKAGGRGPEQQKLEASPLAGSQP